MSRYYSLPYSVTQLLVAIKVVTTVTGTGFGIECLNASLQQYKGQYKEILLEPVYAIAAVIAMYAIVKVIFLASVKNPAAIFREWEISCLRALLFTLNFLYFPVTSTAIDSFRCAKDPVTGISYNTEHPYEECSAIPLAVRISAFLLFSVGMVVIFSALIAAFSRDRKNKNTPGTLAYVIHKSLGFFFAHFRDRYLWFSIAMLLRRFLISLISSLIRVDSSLSFGLNTVVLSAYSIFVVVRQPFRTRSDNVMEAISTQSCVLVYGLVVVMSVPGYSYGVAVVDVFYYFVNISMLLWCLVEFIKAKKITMRIRLD